MGGTVVVATFAPLSPGTDNAAVELRVAPRSAGLTVAKLTVNHAVGENPRGQSLRVGTMVAAETITTIQGMGSWPARAVAGRSNIVGIEVVDDETARRRRQRTRPRAGHAVAKRTGSVRYATVGGAIVILRIGTNAVIVAPLPVGRMRRGGRVASGAVSRRIIEDQRVSDKAAIEDVFRTAMAVAAIDLVGLGQHSVIDRIGERSRSVGDRSRWSAAETGMTGDRTEQGTQAAGSAPPLQLRPMAGRHGATGPADLRGKTLVILNRHGPTGWVNRKRRSRGVTAVTTHRQTTPLEIDIVAALATGKIGIGVNRVLIEPIYRVRLPGWRSLGITVRATGDKEQREQGQQE